MLRKTQQGDTICINPADNEERFIQVQMIARIYQWAFMVNGLLQCLQFLNYSAISLVTNVDDVMSPTDEVFDQESMLYELSVPIKFLQSDYKQPSRRILGAFCRWYAVSVRYHLRSFTPRQEYPWGAILCPVTIFGMPYGSMAFA